MERAQIVAIVGRAVDRLIAEQANLLRLAVGEQTLAQHIAAYIREGIPDGLGVDVEYNKHGMEKKVLLLPPKGAPHADPVPTIVRPDIVVHGRGIDDHNILVLEVKKLNMNLARDRAKLEAFKSQYGYLYAAHIIVGLRAAEPVGEVRWIDG
jgi:hypothetical protein